MPFLKFILAIFLLPGNLVLAKLGINVEEDGGIIRSTVNMIFWSLIALAVILPIMIY